MQWKNYLNWVLSALFVAAALRPRLQPERVCVLPRTPLKWVLRLTYVCLFPPPLQFLRSVLLDVCGSPQTFSEYSLSAGSPSDSVAALARLVRLLYADAVSRGTAEAAFSGKLARLGVAAELVAALGAGLFCAERGALVGQARAKVGAALGGRALLGWDWSVAHVLGSSSVAAAGESLLRLTLVVGPGGAGGEKAAETVAVELTVEEAGALIGQLEEAHAAAVAAAGAGT